MANQVLEIVKRRHHAGSKPGHRDDGHKVALAVEGGGLRGVISGGALAALEALGMKDCFDVVYGASSGAYSAAFFVSGNTLTGARFYLDYSQVQFIGIKRFLRGGPLFDLDYVARIMHTATPLNYHNVLVSKTPLRPVATDAEHSRPMILKDFKSAAELDRALQASSTFPPYPHPRALLFRRRHFVDAALADPFCIHSAIAEKNTHIMVLFSLRWHKPKGMRLVDRKLVVPYLSKINPHLAQTYLRHGEYSVNGLNHVWNHYDGTHILAVQPGKGIKLPHALTRNRKKLGVGFLAGAEAVLHNFAPDEHTKSIILEDFKRELDL